jgi:uracil phosphoribosyltransferase
VGSTLLARLSEDHCHQPELNEIIQRCFRILVEAVVRDHFPTRRRSYTSRMIGSTPAAAYEAETLDPEVRVVVAAVARAGTLPAYDTQNYLAHIVAPSRLRVDHLFMNRSSDADGRVTGIDFHGSKIGGSVEDHILLVPDPMAATGASMLRTIDHYRSDVDGTPSLIACLHLIATPEYLMRLRDAQPAVHVYALRLDRGLSPPDILDSIPGTHWDREIGLDARGYVVPGAGGLGELMNNCDA